jgi:hypothetical protein
MDYWKTLKKTWQVIYQHPYLWLLGLLAGGGGGFQFGYQFSAGDLDSIKNFFKNQDKNIDEVIAQVARAAGEKPVFQQIVDYLTGHWVLALSISIILFLILILLLILSISCEGGLIGAVSKIDKGGKSSFWTSVKTGFKYFWPIFLIRLLLPLLLLLVLAILISPVIGAAIYQLPILSLGWGIIMLILLFPLTIFTGIWIALSIRIVVLGDQGFISAVRKGCQLIKRRLGEVIIVWLIDLAVRVTVGLGVVFVSLIAIFILGGISLFLGLLLAPIGLIIGSLSALALIVGLLIVNGFISSFSAGFWTLSYQEIDGIEAGNRKEGS